MMEQVEMSAGVKILVERMQTHPEEFFDEGGKWKFMYKEYFRDVMTEYEKATMHSAIKNLRRKEFDAKVMQELMKEQAKDRAFGRAMVHKEGQTISYDESWGNSFVADQNNTRAVLTVRGDTEQATIQLGETPLTEDDLKAIIDKVGIRDPQRLFK